MDGDAMLLALYVYYMLVQCPCVLTVACRVVRYAGRDPRAAGAALRQQLVPSPAEGRGGAAKRWQSFFAAAAARGADRLCVAMQT